MAIKTYTALFLGKITSYVSRLFGFGSGIVWAGEIALRFDPQVVSFIREKIPTIILVAGTNGKTTTATMITHIFENNNFSVIHNTTGANLKNGIMGTFITQYNKLKTEKSCIAIFEVDEAEFKNIVPVLCPDMIVLLNLFRDQLDRYGEVNSVAYMWKHALQSIKSDVRSKLTIIANADDPLLQSVVTDLNVKNKSYFGFQTKKQDKDREKDAWGDSTSCPVCGEGLKYETIVFSHLGNWHCENCSYTRNKIDQSAGSIPLQLSGAYNQYNAAAAFLAVKKYGLSIDKHALKDFKPAFGRQEKFYYNGKSVQVFLSKNPTGFNESLRTVLTADPNPVVVLALNDRIPDGTDISWIWDVDFNLVTSQAAYVVCTGDRAWDMGVRVKYSFDHKAVNTKKQKKNSAIQQFNNISIEEDLKKAIASGLSKTFSGQYLYILPTYSAMLDVRKILTGRKIL